MIEDHFLEKNERSGVPFRLHPQERALPAIHNEVSSRVRVQSWSDVPLNLRLLEASPYSMLNSTKDLFQPSLKRFIKHAHFLGEVSYRASAFAFILLLFDASFLEESLKSLDMPYFRGLQDRLPSRSQSFGIVVDQGQTQVFLALEIEIERSLWDSGAFEDFLDTRIVEAFPVNDLRGVSENFVFCAIFGHGLSSFPTALIVDRSSSHVKFFLQLSRIFSGASRLRVFEAPDSSVGRPRPPDDSGGHGPPYRSSPKMFFHDLETPMIHSYLNASMG